VVASGERDCPYIVKIADHKQRPGLPVGTKINDGTMLAIADCLQFYFPEGHSMLSPQTSVERRLEYVNTMWWKTGTSLIVALFLAEEEALSCFNQPELEECDQRWIDKTKEVIKMIGDDHPNITICHYPGLSLMHA
jgi:hypothetical protein